MLPGVQPQILANALCDPALVTAKSKASKGVRCCESMSEGVIDGYKTCQATIIADSQLGAIIPRMSDEIDPARLKAAMAEADLDQSALARRVGVTPGAINQIVTGRTRDSRRLPDIARELGVSVDWLKGRSQTPQQPVSAADVAEQLDAVMIPEVEVGLSMGGGSAMEDWPVVQMVPLSRTWLRGLTTSAPEHLMVARGDGDSMMPTILDQDLVIIDRAQNTPRQQDRIWALTYGGWGMIKRLRSLPDGSLQINSDNAAVSPIVAFDDEAQIIGRVVGVVRRI